MRRYIDSFVIYRNRGHINLNISTCLELEHFAWRQLNFEFLNECRHVVVRNYLALPLLDSEDFLRDSDIEILFNLHLASESHIFFALFSREVTKFCRENITTTRFHDTFAHCARSTTATCRRQEDFLVSECVQQRATRRYRNLLLTINHNLYRTRLHQLFLSQQQH